MKLVPFVLQKQESKTLDIYTFVIFLTEGGKEVWEIGSAQNKKTVKREFLEENGFVCTSLEQKGDTFFAEIDPKTISAFYTYEEIEHGKKREDCFRTFILCFEKSSGEEWFASETLHYPFEKSELTPSALFHGLKNLYKV